MHLWVSPRHKDENETAAQYFLHEMKKKGLKFGFYINMMARTSSIGGGVRFEDFVSSLENSQVVNIPVSSSSEDGVPTNNSIKNYCPIDFVDAHHSEGHPVGVLL